MNLKRNLTVVMAAMAAMAFSFTSCSDETNGNEEETKVEEPTISVPVNINSELGKSSAATRAGIEMTDDANGKLSYNFDQLYTNQTEENPAFDLIVGSIYNTSRAYECFTGVPLQKKSDGTYYIYCTTKTVLVPGAAANHLGDVKFCGMLVPHGTGGTFLNFCKGGVEKDMAELSTLAGNGGKFFVPLYSNVKSDTKSSWHGDGSDVQKSYFDITMNFSMMGTVITAKFTGNPLANDVYIDSVRMRSSNVKSGVITWKMGDEDNSGHPNFTFKGNGESDNKKIGFPQPMLLVSDLFNKGDNKQVYKSRAWVMPVNENDFISDYDIYYHIKGDVDFTPLVVNYPQDESKKKTHTGGFKYGYVYNLAMQMPESDLMITEFEHLNKGKGQCNYSMIELYNPTAHTIDLSKYGLVRLTSWQKPNNPTDAELTETELLNSMEWKAYDYNSSKLLDENKTDPSSNINIARVQDIYIDKTTGTWWEGENTQNYYYQGPANCHTVDGTTITSGFQNTYTIFDGKNYTNTTNMREYPSTTTYIYDIGTHKNYEVKLQPNELGPGQTVIVGAAGIIWEQQKGNAYNRPNEYYWHSKDAYFKNKYLDKAANSGKLKFAVAVDNGGTSNHNAAGSANQSGIMQHTMATVLQLIRLDTKKIIDMPGYMGTTASRYIYSKFIARETSGSTTQKDYFVFSRYASAMYPMYLNSRYYEDHRNREDLLQRNSDGSITPLHPYRMYDWTWAFEDNFNIKGVNDFTLEEYWNYYYSPGTKSFEDAFNESN